jgi:serine/threonine protein kinase
MSPPTSSFQVDRILSRHRNITPDLFVIKTSLSPKTFVGSGSYGKVFRSSRTKLITKEVPCDSLETFRHVVQEVLIQAICAHETKQFVTNPAFASVPPILEVTVTSHEFPLKIRIVTTDAGKPLSDQPMKSKRDLAKVCGAVYQVANLIEHLQKKFKFCHRDVYGNNVLVQQTKTPNCSSAFKANLIDFGMARMNYKGIVLASNAYFQTSRFTPGFDMTLLLYRTFGEQCVLALTCKDLPQDLQQSIQTMLRATGVPFEDVHSVQDLYDFIEDHGVHFKVQVSPTFVKKAMLQFAKTYCA